MKVILFPNMNTERIIITTCFTFPTTFIISGPPSFTALKLATFSAKASIPCTRRSKIDETGALNDITTTTNYLGNHVDQKPLSLKRERVNASGNANIVFYVSTNEREQTMFRRWNVLRGSFPERRYFVMIPLREETVQLMTNKAIPKKVP